MNIASFSQSKYKNAAKPGDDVALLIPGRVLAVFDGATDPTGASYGGLSSGRIAALAAANAVAEMSLDGRFETLAAPALFQNISDILKKEAQRINAGHPPSTTLAIVADMGDSFRLLLAGDSGVRINGTRLFQHTKLIDTVSTSARIFVFKQLLAAIGDGDVAEARTRATIFSGLRSAVANGIMTARDAENVVIAAAGMSGLENNIETVEEFLMGGIRVQPQFANRHGHVLGYASVNGGTVMQEGTVDLHIAKDGLSSVEIFSDGYLSLPVGTDVAAWEAEFARVEAADFHKLGEYPSVKGSTTAEFSDDRTVICLNLVQG
ncbi:MULTISPECIES: hypothetical protein [Rhizobium/Agrobacterium group]|uniref:hypothetical protein n=1 Tax=Rhizobium/Agrobacterium group TaxID=227290 RepID=UPI00107FA263|nr:MULTISPECIES: hypothetical protein [Rhizobium/Agrobacterium group]MBB4403630.1 hypothetical protein [Agrobacterium radiobacter]MBB5589783.1 hypothetical protein [Agrobacterium radiobacter]TGE87476.1 hypothetical protein C9418_19450 [Rhizobium sp. SEMIA 4032]